MNNELSAKEIERLEKEIDAIEERADRYYNAALHLESRDGINACLELAKSMPGIRCSVKDFDAHPLWLNTQTCTMDLETGETWAHRPADMLTKVTNAGYDPTATAPAWDAFLDQVVPDVATQRFLQRSVGYCLSDLMSEQCMWFLYGLGRNGKTTFINAIRRMLGEYAMTTKASTLMVKQHGDDRRSDVAVLKGARFVSATEAEDGQHLAESLLKEITGEDPITARLLYAEFFTFEPTFKIWLAANHKPIIRGTDLAIWRRIHMVPFQETIKPEDIDRELPTKLYAERDGILNWALNGWRDYRQHGLQVPPLVVQATAAYRAEMDPLTDFLEESCVVEDGTSCTASDLYQTYRAWAEGAGVRFPMKQKTLGTQLEERGFTSHRGTGGSRQWRGLRPITLPTPF
jgi:putative DNA primase/helicase